MPQKECKNPHKIIFTLSISYGLPALRNGHHRPVSTVGSYPSEIATASQNTFSAEVMPVSFFAQRSPQIQGMLRQGLACWSSKLPALGIPAYIK